MAMYLLILLLICTSSHFLFALDNGLALTPPMGWLSWERFRCNVDCKNDPENCISERLYMKMADLMVSEGFKDAGYEYVNIDDCWPAKERDSERRLVADPERFPSGIKALANYIHGKGLKLGIYEDIGYSTCAGFPGSEFDMQADANTFAEWNVDMLKFDGCNSQTKEMPYGFSTMERFLNLTGRPILFLCEWPNHFVRFGMQPNYTAVRQSCNQWRNYHDVQDSWDSVLEIIDHFGDDKYNSSQFAGPGGWNDPDMLVVGDFGLSYYQQKAQFGIWALLAAPLMMSVDLRNIDAKAKSLLLNKNIIAINQDPLGNQASRLLEVDHFSVWMKNLSRPQPNCKAVGILNRENHGRPMRFSRTIADLGLTAKNGYNITEAFENKFVGSFKLKEEFSTYVDPTSIYIMIACPL